MTDNKDRSKALSRRLENDKDTDEMSDEPNTSNKSKTSNTSNSSKTSKKSKIDEERSRGLIEGPTERSHVPSRESTQGAGNPV